MYTNLGIGMNVANRAREIFDADRRTLMLHVDKIFAGLMVFQYIAAVFVAFVVSPRTWSGEMSSLHPHVWAATLLGGAITFLPCLLIRFEPGSILTRHVVGVSQMLMGALLIHLTGGRIETHFHVFGSLAFLAFYRDWPVMISASVVVAADHLIRGIYWPESVFGVLTASHWRWIEHAGWVVFIDLFLVASCMRGLREMKDAASRMAELEATNLVIDAKVQERTAELAEHRELLEETVAARTIALQEALENLQGIITELEQANRHKSQFLSTMSHELRTPLNGIIGFTELLYSEGFGPLNDRQKEYVKRVEGSGEHLLALINDILDVAKIDAGTMSLQPETFDVHEAVQSATQMLGAQSKKQNIELALSIPDDIPMIWGDRRKFRQILLNLLSNALKYSPEGSAITVHAAVEGDDEVLFSVSDQGVGIAAGELTKIFDEFHQVDRKRDEALGGVGLGLALTRRLVELHGGHIDVESTVGKGTCFRFGMPRPDAVDTLAQPEKKLEARATEVTQTQPTEKLVLVAEDNEANRVMVETMLTMKNHRVILAHDGRECIELAQQHHPDLILTDIRMPVMDGLEATRQLRGMPEFRRTPIIALTANASAVSERECIDAGCDDYLSKPVKMRQLYAAIEKHLNHQASQVPA